MENRAKNISYQLGDLSGAAIKRQARDARKQERISWLVQLAVPAVLVGLFVWFFAAPIIGRLADLSMMMTTLPGGL